MSDEQRAMNMMKDMNDDYNSVFETGSTPMSEEKQLANIMKGMNNDYSSVLDSEPIPDFETDNEIRAAVEYFEERVSAIARYSNDFFVERAVERLQAQFEKRATDLNTPPILASLYEDMVNDLPYRVSQERSYIAIISNTKK